MSTAGSVDLVCERRGARTVVTRSHHAGLARSSRLPRRSDGGAHVMLGTLGPGVLRGDRFVTSGRLGPGASLVVTGQMATPVFPGAAATIEAHWDIATGARLCAIGQPLVPLAGSSLTSVLTFDVAGSGLAIAGETLALGHDATLGARTIGRIDGAVVLRDVLELRPALAQAEAVGSVYAIAADAALRARLTGAAWALVEAIPGVRGGVGGCDGAVVVRVVGAPFAVGEATAAVAERLLALSADARA
jgi:urease accessory protein UreH